MRVTESAAYLKGLAEGMDLGENTKESKIISKMLDVIEEMAARIDALEEENNELYACVEEISSDLAGLEDDFYGLDGEAEYDELDDLLDDEEIDADEYYELECPSCGEVICFAGDIDLDSLTCPACGELVGDIELCDGECEGCAEKDSCDQK
ncbi:MAG: hypothetical protein IKC87_05760 [Clostridia bacterium]|nr:hypothetical protein [Clostridia bacterium]